MWLVTRWLYKYIHPIGSWIYNMAYNISFHLKHADNDTCREKDILCREKDCWLLWIGRVIIGGYYDFSNIGMSHATGWLNIEWKQSSEYESTWKDPNLPYWFFHTEACRGEDCYDERNPIFPAANENFEQFAQISAKSVFLYYMDRLSRVIRYRR